MTLNLTVEGFNQIIGDSHPGLQLVGEGSGTVNITLANDSRLELDALYNNIRSINENIIVNILNTSGVSGLGNLANRELPLYLGTGTMHDHEGSDFESTQSRHTGTCDICGAVIDQIHNFYYYSVDENSHKAVCEICNYEFTGEHNIVYEYCCDTDHELYCDLCDEYIDYQEHVWTETVIPGSDANFSGIEYTCLCGASRFEEDPDQDFSNAMEIVMYDDFGDGWNDAKLIIYKDGAVLRELEMRSGGEQTVHIPYSDECGYAFVWSSGSYDEECGLTVTLPGQTEPVYSHTNFYDIEDGTLLFQLNTADYTLVNQALEKIPAKLDNYTLESVEALNEIVQGINWSLGKSKQETVNGYIADIEAAIEALEPSEVFNGFIYMNDGDLYITETGYSRGDGEEEIPYTGRYYLLGSTSEYQVTVKSGSHEIVLSGLDIIYDGSPFTICNGAEVNMILMGENNLKAGYGYDEYAGLNVPEGAKLHILKESTGSLYVYGGDDAAGIGGNEREDAGIIIIDGGDITALSEGDGAGIGGGWKGAAGEIVINGGNIYAECLDDDGAGIGGGDRGQGGSITINGGNITALSLDDDGAGIGAGSDGDFYDFGYVDEIVINGGIITAGSDDGAAIGSGADFSRSGDITINGGIIIVSPEHLDDIIIGSASSYYKYARSGNNVIINGGNIIADDISLAYGVQPVARDINGQEVTPYTFTIDQEMADTVVTITLPDGSSRQVAAYGTRITTFLPVGLNMDEITISYEKADYTAVENALENVPEDLSIYTAESAAALKEAIDSVEWDLDVRSQEAVNAMAKAIEDAIANLQIMDNPGNTGDCGSMMLWITLLALIAVGTVFMPMVRRKLRTGRR